MSIKIANYKIKTATGYEKVNLRTHVDAIEGVSIVTKTGDYNDLLNAPDIETGYVSYEEYSGEQLELPLLNIQEVVDARVDSLGIEHSTLSARLNEDSNRTKIVSDELDKIKDQVTANKPIIISDDYPIGGFMWFTSSSIPDGWVICNGQDLSASTYKELFNVIGNRYGGNGSSFKVPNLITEGRFVRAYNGSSESIGSAQGNEIQGHTHTVGVGNAVPDGIAIPAWSAVGVNSTGGNNNTTYYGASTLSTGGSETRPVNISLVPCIKAKQISSNMITVAQEWTNFKDRGGAVGGNISITNNGSDFKHYSVERVLNGIKHKSNIGVASDGSVIIQLEKDGVNTSNYHLEERALYPNIHNKISLGKSQNSFSNLFLNGISRTANGYTKLPNGMILQWGAIQIDNPSVNSYHTITFPIAFTQELFRFIHSNEAWDVNSNPRTIGSFARKEQATITSQQIRIGEFHSNTTCARITWYAIGY